MLDGRRRGNVGNAGTAGDKKSKTHDTVYHRTLGGAEANALGKLAGYNPNASHKKTPVAKYLLAHAVLCVALICVSPLFYRSYAAHTAFVCALLCCSVWNGARRYYWIMTKGYEKRLRALLPEDRARGERDKKEE